MDKYEYPNVKGSLPRVMLIGLKLTSYVKNMGSRCAQWSNGNSLVQVDKTMSIPMEMTTKFVFATMKELPLPAGEKNRMLN